MINNSKILVGVSLTLIASAALADGDYFSPTDERVALSLGVVHLSSATSMRVDNSAGTAGTTFNGESDLGLDSSDVEPKFEAAVRTGGTTRLFFDYFSLDRSDTKVLASGPAAYGDVVLLAGDPVQTDLNLRVFGVGFGHSFLHFEKFELTGIIAINDTELNSSVRVQSATRHVYDSQSLAGPFPTPAIALTWAPFRHFYFDANAKYMKISVDHLSGTLSVYDADVFYRIHPNVALALGYSDTRVNLVSRQQADQGAFVLESKGPELFLRVAF
ncbi:MAG: hypothetical protein ABSF94_02645 [Steroidobacteraceae bacterium]